MATKSPHYSNNPVVLAIGSLHKKMANLDKWLELSFICSKPYLLGGWANGAAVAQRLYTPLVGGSNPSSPTIFPSEN